MTSTLSSSANWATIISCVVAVLLFFGGIVAFFVHRFFRWLDEKLSSIDKKTSANGGHSLDIGDSIARIETKQDEQRDILLYHLAHHPGESLPRSYRSPPAPTTETMTPKRRELEQAAELPPA